MDAENNTYLYIVFSNTPYKMGSFIRFFTRGEFNHVSFALRENLAEMYSFARLKRDTPFCGGFVHEGAERYINGKRVAKIAVCAVDVGEEGVARVRKKIGEMNADPDRYVYNMLSALLVPCKKSVAVRDSYTCVEFITSILDLAGYPLGKEAYSAMQLYEQLRQFETFKGQFPSSAPTVDGTYTEHISFSRSFRLSAQQLGRLWKNRIGRKERAH